MGDWYKAMLSYTGNTMKRLEFPSDFKPDYRDDAEVGLTVDVNMEPEPDTYTAYCPYLDESIIFHASNYWEEDDRRADLPIL